MAKNDSRKPPSGTSAPGDKISAADDAQLKAEAEAAAELLKKQELANKNAREILENLKKQGTAQREINAVIGKSNNALDDQLDIINENIEALVQKAKAEKETLGIIQEETRELLKQEAARKRTAEAGKKVAETLKSEAKAIGDIALSIAPIQKAISPAAYVEHAKALDEVQASVSKTTGASREYSERLFQVQRGVNGVNLSLQESGQLLADVRLQYNKFALVEGTQFQETLEKNATILSKFGLSTGESIKQVSEIQSVMGESGDKAIDLQKKMVKAGQAIGMSATDITTKFTTSMDRFAMFGSKMGDQFLKMQSFSKAANLELDKTMSIAERASTFEGAAEMAGRVNAIANRMILDPTKLIALAEDPQKQMEYIQKQLKGINFQNMGVQERRAYGAAAQAGGIGSFTDLMKIVNAKPEELKKMTGLAEAGAAGGDAELEARAKDAMTAQEMATNGLNALMTQSNLTTSALDYMRMAALKYADAVSNTPNPGLLLAETAGSYALLSASLSRAASWFSDFIGGTVTKGLGRLLSGMGSKLAGVGKLLSSGGKLFGKALGGVGTALSGYSAYNRFMEGDVAGGFIDIGAAAAPWVGGAIGTALGGGVASAGTGTAGYWAGQGVAAGLTAWNAKRDMDRAAMQQPAQDGEFDKSGILSSRSAGSFKPKMPAGVGGYVLTAGSMKPFSDKDKVTTSTSDLHVGQIAAAISEALSNTLNVRVINSDEMRGGSFSLSTV
jgi:hypothetical protein